MGTAFSIGGSYLKLNNWVKSNDFAKESSSAFGALLNGIGTGYREVVQYPADQKFSDFADLGVFMTNVFEQTRTALNDMQENLAIGNYWGGNRFLYV
jgi:methylsterol monooxygenase